jgi:hypothetical protein
MTTLKVPKKASQVAKSKSLSKPPQKIDDKSKSVAPKTLMEEFKDNVEKMAIKRVAKQTAEKEEKIISINKEEVDGDQKTEKEAAKGRQRTNSSSINVLGYTMLTKQGVAIDPLMVGCVYRNDEKSKYFVKMRRLMYQVSYILNFIYGSQLSGNMTNLASGIQSMQRKMSKDQLEGIL